MFSKIVRLQDAEPIFGNLSFKVAFHIFWEVVPHKAQKNSACFHAWRPSSQLGGMKLSVCGGVKSTRNWDIYFGGAQEVLVPLTNCLQIPCFVVYSSPLPMISVGGLLVVFDFGHESTFKPCKSFICFNYYFSILHPFVCLGGLVVLFFLSCFSVLEC